MVGDLVQATTLANAAVMELKTAALQADTSLQDRIAEAGKCETELAGQVAVGSQLVQKIARITAAAKTQQGVPTLEPVPELPKAKTPEPVEPQNQAAVGAAAAGHAPRHRGQSRLRPIRLLPVVIFAALALLVFKGSGSSPMAATC